MTISQVSSLCIQVTIGETSWPSSIPRLNLNVKERQERWANPDFYGHCTIWENPRNIATCVDSLIYTCLSLRNQAQVQQISRRSESKQPSDGFTEAVHRSGDQSQANEWDGSEAKRVVKELFSEMMNLEAVSRLNRCGGFLEWGYPKQLVNN